MLYFFEHLLGRSTYNNKIEIKMVQDTQTIFYLMSKLQTSEQEQHQHQDLEQ